MSTITRKEDIRLALEACLQKYNDIDCNDFINELNQRVLQQKVKFPLLEFCAVEICEAIPVQHQMAIVEAIAQLSTEGGNVIIGIVLQKRLEKHFNASMFSAADYIARADTWYVPDIIGERVFGWALLYYFDKALPLLQQFAVHNSHWVVRSVGAGSHYAIKKGLDFDKTKQLFELLISLAMAKDYHIKTGIGWAAKTAVKFHPQIVEHFTKRLENQDKVGQWFRNKVRIGLARNAYGKGN